MTKKKYPLLIANIGQIRSERLRTLSRVSEKTMSALVREALDLLFSPVGVKQ